MEHLQNYRNTSWRVGLGIVWSRRRLWLSTLLLWLNVVYLSELRYTNVLLLAKIFFYEEFKNLIKRVDRVRFAEKFPHLRKFLGIKPGL